MDLKTIEMVLDVLERDDSLGLETNLGRRLNQIDLISFLQGHGSVYSRNADFASVEERLATFKQHLTVLNTRLFDRLRTQIREGNYTPDSLRREFNQYTDYTAHQEGLVHIGADALDALLDGILELRVEAPFTPLPSQNMVLYVPTPARVILDAVDGAGLMPEDVFYDLGSGLGRVAILAHLVSGATVKGVEIDPAHYERACDYASKLGLSNVEFINADARNIDYRDGSVFFMYTPFMGDVFETAIAKLHQVAQTRPIRVCTYGPCTAWAAEQPWLRTEAEDVFNSFTVVTFHSLPPSA